ncbi:hypothetical protein Acr_00g0089420 [Actinidia rufa]|uniref:Uncharacterized protein n=1 Tax=Actinidia rufa TaxID=165716 RepID=A0A7J0DZ41_9ERIC|nr:hypothetical protein Acr_00g0089420 [Actinidia rufa]
MLPLEERLASANGLQRSSVLLEARASLRLAPQGVEARARRLDTITVLSFLGALEDSLPRISEFEESRQGEKEKDLISRTCNRSDPMDEGQ